VKGSALNAPLAMQRGPRCNQLETYARIIRNSRQSLALCLTANISERYAH